MCENEWEIDRIRQTMKEREGLKKNVFAPGSPWGQRRQEDECAHAVNHQQSSLLAKFSVTRIGAPYPNKDRNERKRKNNNSRIHL